MGLKVTCEFHLGHRLRVNLPAGRGFLPLIHLSVSVLLRLPVCFNQAHNTLSEEEREAEHSAFQKSRKTRKAQGQWPASSFACSGCHWMDVLHQEGPQSRTYVTDERNVSLGEFVEMTHPSHKPRELQPPRKQKESIFSNESESSSFGQGADCDSQKTLSIKAFY